MPASRLSTLDSDNGSSLLELVIILPLFTLIFVILNDFGRACYLAVEVSSAAAAGASYGTQNSGDFAGMQAAALLNAPNILAMKASAIRGCECSDGSSVHSPCIAAPNCPTNIVDYVTVRTSYYYHPLLIVPGIISGVTLNGYSKQRVGR
jgi:hypothetical protein